MPRNLAHSPAPEEAMSAGDPSHAARNSDRPRRLSELTWRQAVAAVRQDPRLLVPVGTLLQHGPHLPLGTDIIVVTRLAEEISRRRGVLLAPTIPFGAGSERDAEYAGSAPVRGKTLHRTLNELVSSWERHGFREFVLLTAHGFGPHLQALATVASETARVRAVDLHAVDLSEFLDVHHGGEHGGELATSLMLHLEPELVRTEEIEDLELPTEVVAGLRVGEEPIPPPGSSGVVGRPSIASAEKGRRVFEHLVEFLGERLFGGSEITTGGER